MKSWKRHMMDGMELSNQEKIRTLDEKETCKYFGMLKADTNKQAEMKKKIKIISRERENYSRQNYIAGTI